MTRSELKSIINECLEEVGVVPVTEAYDEDEVELESCEMVLESCYLALELSADQIKNASDMSPKDVKAKIEKQKEFAQNHMVDKVKAFKRANPGATTEEAMKAIKKEAEEKAAQKMAAELGGEKKGFKVFGKNIKAIDPKKAGIAAAATAAVAAGIAGGVVFAKKHKKSEEEKKDEK